MAVASNADHGIAAGLEALAQGFAQTGRMAGDDNGGFLTHADSWF